MTAAGINATYIQGYANSITGAINNILVPVLISIAFIVFLWGIYKYFIKGASNESEKGEGRMFALYGIIGFVILFSVWGIVQIFMGTLGLTASNAPAMPTIGGSGTGTTPTGSLFPAGGTSGGYNTGSNVGGTTSGSYPIPVNADGSCQTGYHLASLGGYCISDSSTGGSSTTGLPNGSGCTSNGACASKYCDFTVDSCAASGGTIPNGSACTTNTGCASGYCTNNVCTDSFGSSTTGLPNDSNCTSSSVCASGYCDMNYDMCSAAPSSSSGGSSGTTLYDCPDGTQSTDPNCGITGGY